MYSWQAQQLNRRRMPNVFGAATQDVPMTALSYPMVMSGGAAPKTQPVGESRPVLPISVGPTQQQPKPHAGITRPILPISVGPTGLGGGTVAGPGGTNAFASPAMFRRLRQQKQAY